MQANTEHERARVRAEVFSSWEYWDHFWNERRTHAVSRKKESLRLPEGSRVAKPFLEIEKLHGGWLVLTQITSWLAYLIYHKSLRLPSPSQLAGRAKKKSFSTDLRNWKNLRTGLVANHKEIGPYKRLSRYSYSLVRQNVSFFWIAYYYSSVRHAQMITRVIGFIRRRRGM